MNRAHRSFSTLILASALLLGSRSVNAAPPAEDPQRAEARARFEEGVKLAQADQHERALLKFQQAWVMLKTPSVLFNIARAEQMTGRRVDAWTHYREYARMPNVTDEERARVAERVAELDKQVARLSIVAPAGATILLDGRELAAHQETLAVPDGFHNVRAILGDRTATRSFTASAGHVATVSFDDLQASATNAPPSPVASAPPPPHESAETHGRSRAGIVVHAALLGVGVASVAAGALFSLSSRSKRDDAETLARANPGLCAVESSDLCGQYRDLDDHRKTSATLGWVFYGVGAAAITGSVATFLLWPKQSRRVGFQHVVPALAFGGGGATASVVGRF